MQATVSCSSFDESHSLENVSRIFRLYWIPVASYLEWVDAIQLKEEKEKRKGKKLVENGKKEGRDVERDPGE